MSLFFNSFILDQGRMVMFDFYVLFCILFFICHFDKCTKSTQSFKWCLSVHMIPWGVTQTPLCFTTTQTHVPTGHPSITTARHIRASGTVSGIGLIWRGFPEEVNTKGKMSIPHNKRAHLAGRKIKIWKTHLWKLKLKARPNFWNYPLLLFKIIISIGLTALLK